MLLGLHIINNIKLKRKEASLCKRYFSLVRSIRFPGTEHYQLSDTACVCTPMFTMFLITSRLSHILELGAQAHRG